MSALALVMTTAGLGRFTAAQASDDIDLTVASVGITNAAFTVAPSLTALPGEFRRLATVSGDQVGDRIVHMVVRDDGPGSYTVRGFGLFLADGTLFAVYGQPGAIVEKSASSTLLLALDIAFPTADVASLSFGDTNFLNPPATRTRAGVVEFADEVELGAGAPNRAASAADLAARLPIGVISMWYGTAAAVPAGWALCNGQVVARSDGAGNLTTPDLRDRVVVGAGAHAAGAAFGAAEKTAATKGAGAHSHRADLPDHTHGAGALAATVGKAYTGTGLTYSAKTDTAGGGTGKTIALPPDSGSSPPAITDPGHHHDATMSGNTALSGAGTISTSSDGTHAHEVTIDVTQPSYALHFIMKV